MSKQIIKKKNKYNCPICFEFIYNKKVYQCKSGHFACQECWEKSLKIKKECMICRSEINSITDLSRCIVIEQDFGKKECYCIYSFTEGIGSGDGKEKQNETIVFVKDEENGCSKILKVDDILSHVSVCNYKIEKCPNEGCFENIRTISKEKHLNECLHKLVKCEHCGRDDIKKIKVESHLSCCPKVLIDCLQCCSMKIERGEIENHITNDLCNTIVPCKYFEQGCYVLLKRSNLPNHLEDKWIISNYNKEISDYKVLFSQSFYFENQEFLVVLKDFSYSYFQSGISIRLRSEIRIDFRI
ncbi:hypothetical protein ACTFIW_008999 [Dictyostelium discoideum]